VTGLGNSTAHKLRPAINDVLSGKRSIADAARLWKVSAATMSRLVSTARRERTKRPQAPCMELCKKYVDFADLEVYDVRKE
jgi:transposase-like protein